MKRDIDIIRQLDDTEDAIKRARLRTMQAVALGLLVLAALLFALARWQHGGHPAWGYLEAFSEAAMVGAIADWFAVTALFRHPLGIPLWHTAIIPNSKDSIGKSLGNFVENHFITEEGIALRIRQIDIAGRAGLYMQNHAAQLSGWVGPALEKLMQMADHDKIRRMLRELATRELARVDLSALAGDCVEALVAEDLPQEWLEAALDQLVVYLVEPANHPAIETMVQSAVNTESSVLKYALHKAMPRIIRSTAEKVAQMRLDRSHELRQRLGTWIANSALRLKGDPAWQDAIGRYQQQALASDTVRDMLDGIWDTLRARLLADLRSETPSVPAGARRLVENAGKLLTDNPAVRDSLNRSIEAGSAQLVKKYRGEVGLFIEAQLATWTKEQMSERIELSIGRDLQFIRINGTLVGGLVGVVIHFIVGLF
ncbi:uncharacterized membrane-anchored protein YjiN (DUF445 family) [Duganella sp. 1411]|uniref:DUF445 domain-containing protein n=1 Tax=Duganella sp. 1411 TaxID=2806572 RepID=UPI001AE82D74|nr:DUF445 domain-containing protein [Duganella sp. 1411]MBP1202667.1 uncharacterized membrane-anchored protein YjiN (DUF445 family) [Duganella sp. 1411]